MGEVHRKQTHGLHDPCSGTVVMELRSDWGTIDRQPERDGGKRDRKELWMAGQKQYGVLREERVHRGGRRNAW